MKIVRAYAITVERLGPLRTGSLADKRGGKVIKTGSESKYEAKSDSPLECKIFFENYFLIVRKVIN